MAVVAGLSSIGVWFSKPEILLGSVMDFEPQFPFKISLMAIFSAESTVSLHRYFTAIHR